MKDTFADIFFLLKWVYGEVAPTHVLITYDLFYASMNWDIIRSGIGLALFSTKSLPKTVATHYQFDALWPLLLTWFNFNPSMDK